MTGSTPLMSPDSRHQQARKIIEHIARGTANSRSALARHLGLAASTVSLRVQELVELGLIFEEGVGESQGGRRPRLLRLRENRGHLLVADVGGQHVRIGRLDMTGALIETRDLGAQVEAGPSEALRIIAESMREMTDSLDRKNDSIRGVAIALPGPVNMVSGSVELPSRMPGWQGFPVSVWLEKEFGVPVVVDNDANLMAFGEHHAQLSTSQHSITVKAGTAIGSGIIVNGAIHHGATGAAGDVTHTRIMAAASIPCSCGNTGCLETVASGAGLVRQLRERGFDVSSTAEVLSLTRHADPIATTLVRTAGTYLGEVLSSVVNFFNPHALFLTGGMASCDPFIAAVRSSIYDGCHPLVTQNLRIESAKTGANAGILGGGRLVLEKVLFLEN